MLVLTYNIRRGHGIDNRYSLARIADIVRASGAHIACMQEVGRKWPQGRFADQPKWLGERLAMEFVFQPNLSYGPSGFGNLILSKYPILSVKSHSLTSHGEQRGLLEVRVSAPETPITVFCTHWGLSSDERIVQSAETASFIKSAETPVLLCGDLNDFEDSPPLVGLLSSTGLHDLVRDSTEPEMTFPADHPRARIDYILGSSELRGISAAVLDTPASDHRPVIVEVVYQHIPQK